MLLNEHRVKCDWWCQFLCENTPPRCLSLHLLALSHPGQTLTLQAKLGSYIPVSWSSNACNIDRDLTRCSIAAAPWNYSSRGRAAYCMSWVVHAAPAVVHHLARATFAHDLLIAPMYCHSGFSHVRRPPTKDLGPYTQLYRSFSAHCLLGPCTPFAQCSDKRMRAWTSTSQTMVVMTKAFSIRRGKASPL